MKLSNLVSRGMIWTEMVNELAKIFQKKIAKLGRHHVFSLYVHVTFNRLKIIYWMCKFITKS